MVLAIRKNGRPADAARIVNWHPVPQEQAYEFESVVGEKQMLRVEEETANESEYESYFPNKAHRRDRRSQEPHDRRGDHRPGHARVPPNYRGGNHNRGRGGNRNPTYGNRGGARAGFRGDRGGGGRGRGRGGGGGGASQYKSLDDVDHGYPQRGNDNPDAFY